ncbi:MAG: FecR domain-containing protein [Burkholderiales bacterium]|nr:FecR domain-containing protein [Burkholderiales bacterium]
MRIVARWRSGVLAALIMAAGTALAQAPAPDASSAPPAPAPTSPGPTATPAAPPAAAVEAGSIERVAGSVLISVGGVSRAARQGERLNVGELLITEAGAEALLRLRDQSTLALRPASRVLVSDLRLQDPGGDALATNLLRGSLRYVSGLIARARPQGVVFRTPTATVGIRGTDFEIAIVPDGERDRAGVYNFVHDGQTNVSLPSGEALDVARDQTGFAPDNPQPGEPALQLLRERPAFLRGGGFDAMMQQVGRPPPPIFMPRMR